MIIEELIKYIKQIESVKNCSWRRINAYMTVSLFVDPFSLCFTLNGITTEENIKLLCDYPCFDPSDPNFLTKISEYIRFQTK